MRKIVATIAAAAALAAGAGHAAAAPVPFTASTTTPVVGQTVTFVADPCGRCAYKWTITSTNPVSHKTTTWLTDVHDTITWTFYDGTSYTFLLRETGPNGTNQILATGQLSLRAVPAP